MRKITVINPDRNRVIMRDYFENLNFKIEQKRKMSGITEPTGRLILELEDDLAEILIKEFKHFRIDYIVREIKWYILTNSTQSPILPKN